MLNPTRRNRNIGTAKQGHGKNNKMEIPWPAVSYKSFHERLTDYKKEYRTINGNRFEFVTEKTRNNSEHACTIEDLAEILRHIVPADYGRLNLIILRQPKRKEEILASAWGRLVYSYSFENDFRPAVILEAQDLTKKLKWSRSLNPDEQQELNRLIKDGHEIIEDKRHHIIKYSLESIRNTQLYRTLPHEIGHYKHFLELVGEIEDSPEEEEFEDYEKREKAYHNLISSVKESYAHKYADDLCEMLRKSRAIPFDRITSEI